LPPSQIVPKLADQKIYLASESTFYRILREEEQLKHRGIVRAKMHHKPAELIATRPNQIWSWDITYLRTEIAGKFFYLYLFLDVFSRKIVGFEIFEQESAEDAAAVVSKAYGSEGIRAGEVTLHSDNGGPMKGCTMLVMLQKLGIIPSFSRPSVSNDNPFSESLFRTLKYCPQYPSKSFSFIEEAKAWMLKFVYWYNHVHQHSGINFVTPHARHQGLDKVILANRTRVYEAAKQRYPNRWSGKIRNWEVAGSVCLNPKHTTCKAA
jgi:putative transposase